MVFDDEKDGKVSKRRVLIAYGKRKKKTRSSIPLPRGKGSSLPPGGGRYCQLSFSTESSFRGGGGGVRRGRAGGLQNPSFLVLGG